MHKRLSEEFVEEILEAFTEERACELLGIKRVRFYRKKDGALTYKGKEYIIPQVKIIIYQGKVELGEYCL